MENKIQTAEDTRLKYIPNGCVNIKGKGLGDGKPQKKYEDNLLDQMLIEFAKLHVEAALKTAAKSTKFYFESNKGEVHFDVYPLTNIK
jgi:hypothetical protein